VQPTRLFRLAGFAGRGLARGSEAFQVLLEIRPAEEVGKKVFLGERQGLKRLCHNYSALP